jgi:hypothetical protein
VWKGGGHMDGAAGIKGSRDAGAWIELDVESGQYSFTVARS